MKSYLRISYLLQNILLYLSILSPIEVLADNNFEGAEIGHESYIPHLTDYPAVEYHGKLTNTVELSSFKGARKYSIPQAIKVETVLKENSIRRVYELKK